MNRHRPFLELAATAIDYPLEMSERRHLDEHLTGCRECARAMTALGADAAAIGSLPPVRLAERRGDQILAAALRPAAGGRPLRLVAIAALLALLITGSIAVGAVLLHRADQELSVVVPLPSATASPEPDATSSPTSSPAASSRPIVFTPWGNLVATRAEGGNEWVELLKSDASAIRLAAGSDPRWLTADRIVYVCPQASPDFLGTCVVDQTSPEFRAAPRCGGGPARAGAQWPFDRVPPRHDRRRRDVAGPGRRFRESPAGGGTVPGLVARWGLAGGPTGVAHRAGRDRRR